MPSSPLSVFANWESKHVLCIIFGFILGCIVTATILTDPFDTGSIRGTGQTQDLENEEEEEAAIELPQESSCDDGVDNDADSLTDCEDHPECSFAPNCAEDCSDEIDNDEDGDEDCDDDWCAEDPACMEATESSASHSAQAFAPPAQSSL